MGQGIVGFGGQVLLTIGGQTKAVGELRRWRAVIERDDLDTTTQADEDTTATAGRRSFSGQFEFNTVFKESAECWSSYQLIQFVLQNSDDEAKCLAMFTVQSEEEAVHGGMQSDLYLWGEIIPKFSVAVAPLEQIQTSECVWSSAGRFQLSQATEEQIDGIINIYLENQTVSNLPPGGEPGQVLAKVSGASYDTDWVDPSGGGAIALGDVSDVILAAPISTHVLRYDGSGFWRNDTPDLDGGVFM